MTSYENKKQPEEISSSPLESSKHLFEDEDLNKRVYSLVELQKLVQAGHQLFHLNVVTQEQQSEYNQFVGLEFIQSESQESTQRETRYFTAKFKEYRKNSKKGSIVFIYLTEVTSTVELVNKMLKKR